MRRRAYRRRENDHGSYRRRMSAREDGPRVGNFSSGHYRCVYIRLYMIVVVRLHAVNLCHLLYCNTWFRVPAYFFESPAHMEIRSNPPVPTVPAGRWDPVTHEIKHGRRRAFMRASHVECLELVVNRKTQGAQASNQAWAANDCVMQKYQAEIQRWAIKRGLNRNFSVLS